MNHLPAWLDSSASDPSTVALILLLKLTLLFGLAWLVHAALRRANPRWRVLLWRGTASASVLLVVLAVSPPLVAWPVLPAEEQADSPLRDRKTERVSETRTPRQHEVTAVSPGEFPSRADEPATARPVAETGPAERHRLPMRDNSDATGQLASSIPEEHLAVQNQSATISSNVALPEDSRLSLPAGFSVSPIQVAVGIWLTGLALLSLRTALALRTLARIRRRSDWVSPSIVSEAQSIADQVGCSRIPELRQTDEMSTPCLAGLRRPLILLPEMQCRPELQHELPGILAHELAHLSGRDLIWNGILHFVSSVLWLHPLAWRIRRTHAAACDEVADAVAADCTGDAEAYGRTLAQIAVRVSAPMTAAGLAMARTSSVRRRIEALQRQASRLKLPRGRVVCLGVVGFALSLLLGGSFLTRSEAAQPDAIEAGQNQPASGQAAESRNESETDKKKTGANDERDTGRARVADGLMTTRVVDASSNAPLEGVALDCRGFIGKGRFNRPLKTDARGLAKLEWKAGDIVRNLMITAKLPRFTPVHYMWRSERRSVELPAALDLELERGVTVGGIVRDQEGKPVAGAQVSVRLPITYPRLANYVFTPFSEKTDEKGRWLWNAAPKDLGNVYSRIRHPDFLDGGGRIGRGIENVVVLDAGLTVSGKVVDSNGKPIEGAIARLGFDRFGTDEPTSLTIEDGTFELRKCKPGESLVTVQCRGYAPQFHKVTVGDQPEPLNFELEPGREMRVRVVDVKGRTLKGVTFVTDTWRGYRTLEFRSQTDAEGRVVWKSAPPDTVQCDILKSGLMAVRNAPLKASDEELVVTMHALLVISGRVTDAKTGKPVPSFGIARGAKYRGQSRIYWTRDAPVKYSGGKFSYRFDEPSDGYKLQVVAPGYLPSTSRLFASTEGKTTFDFKLEPGSGPTGLIVDATGKPVEGVQVALASSKKRISLKRGHFDRDSSSGVVRTDKDGRFRFVPQEDESFVMIAIHDAGFAEATADDLKKPEPIRLTPWGRIAGQVRLGGKPEANREVSYQPDSSGLKSRRAVFSFGYETKTNSQGFFLFDRVIPGPGSVSRVLVTEFLESWSHAPGWHQYIEVKSGETLKVRIGGTGRPVTGLVKLDRRPDVEIKWTKNEPVRISRWDPENGRRSQKYFSCLGHIDRDGRFRIEDVPPGHYRLTIPVNNPPSPTACGAGTVIGSGQIEFAIPEQQADYSEKPFDVGIVTAKLSDTLDPGELAPEFAAENLAGGTLRLSDLGGRLVLLDFWATWCGPCLSRMPEMNELNKEFEKDPRFVLVGMSCDRTSEEPKNYLQKAGYNWLQTRIGGTFSRVARDYTVRNLPATFLIAPDGKVLAKNLSHEDLRQAIRKALANEKLFNLKAGEKRLRFPVTRFPVRPVPQLKAEPAAVLLDDVDPGYDKGVSHHDELRLLAADGTELWKHADLHISGSVGGVHTLAIDQKRSRIFVCENLRERIVAFNFEGQRLWQIDRVEADVIALDEKTGNLWCSGGRQLNQGETVVFDPDGKELATFPLRAIDMAYDRRTDSFWLVGYELWRVSREGKVLVNRGVEGWCCASVSVNPVNGQVWMTERDHPDVDGSGNRVWHLDSEGKVLHRIDLKDFDPFTIECNPRTGAAWVAHWQSGVHRISSDGQLGGLMKSKARHLAVRLSTGRLCAANSDGVWRLDENGKPDLQHPLKRKSQHSVLAAW